MPKVRKKLKTKEQLSYFLTKYPCPKCKSKSGKYLGTYVDGIRCTSEFIERECDKCGTEWSVRNKTKIHSKKCACGNKATIVGASQCRRCFMSNRTLKDKGKFKKCSNAQISHFVQAFSAI